MSLQQCKFLAASVQGHWDQNIRIMGKQKKSSLRYECLHIVIIKHVRSNQSSYLRRFICKMYFSTEATMIINSTKMAIKVMIAVISHRIKFDMFVRRFLILKGITRGCPKL